MNTSFPDRRFLDRLQENPHDLRRMSAADAARALFDFIQRTYERRGRMLVVVAGASRGAGDTAHAGVSVGKPARSNGAFF